ncbi:MAG: ribonuclease P protein component [Oleispira sp.]|jgi:ribonuclease P protein component
MNTFEFPRSVRLLSPGDFSQVFDNTEFKASNRYLLVLATPSKSGDSRLGFVISKKHVKHAVQRNRIKRIIRESFRLNQYQMADNDFVILARPGISDLENSEIREMIDSLWFKLRQSNGKRSSKSKKR